MHDGFWCEDMRTADGATQTAGQSAAPLDGPADVVDVIAAMLRARFGDACVKVARTQLARAPADCAARWSAVLARLDR